jgi:glycerate kinase
MLLGPNGVARVYGPQKGASAQEVRQMEAGLERFAAIVRRLLGMNFVQVAGAGASGGLGAGLKAFLGARLVSRYVLMSRFLDIERHLENADLVFTAEGSLDAGSAAGKVPAEVGRLARRMGIPVIALAGSIGNKADIVLDHGIGAYFATVPAPCLLDEAMARAEIDIERCADNIMRTVVMSYGLGFAAAARVTPSSEVRIGP